MSRTQPTLLFQLPLTESDVSRFKNPDTQPLVGAINCGAVSAQLIGIVTRGISTDITSAERGMYIQEWVDSMNEAAGFAAYSWNIGSKVGPLFDNLFNGHATMVLVDAPAVGVGHYFVIARDNDGIPYVLDPQAALLGNEHAVFQGEEKIEEYLASGGLTGNAWVFTTEKPMTVSEHMSLYTASTLATLFDRICSV